MQTMISAFWRRWMLVTTASMVMMGLVLAFTPLITDIVDPLYFAYFDSDDYSTLPEGDLRFHRFLFGVMGAVLASWSMLMFVLVFYPLGKGQRWAWVALASSLVIWFVGDGYASVVTGFAVHAVLNLSLLIIMGIPLLATYRQTQ